MEWDCRVTSGEGLNGENSLGHDAKSPASLERKRAMQKNALAEEDYFRRRIVSAKAPRRSEAVDGSGTGTGPALKMPVTAV